jgi:hypothetical protein
MEQLNSVAYGAGDIIAAGGAAANGDIMPCVGAAVANSGLYFHLQGNAAGNISKIRKLRGIALQAILEVCNTNDKDAITQELVRAGSNVAGKIGDLIHRKTNTEIIVHNQPNGGWAGNATAGPLFNTLQALSTIHATRELAHSLGYEGYLRYNSKLVRWTEWFVHLQRIMRLLMRKELAWTGNVVTTNLDAIAEETSTYENNNVYKIEDFE